MTYIRRLILALALSAGLAPAFAQVPPPVPALPDTERRTTYSISASTCACNVNFALYGDSTDYANWIEVFVNGVRMAQAGNWTLSSVTGTIGSIPLPITNAVLTFTAPQTGTIQIVGARRPRRTSQFNEGVGVPTRNFNVILSDLTAQNRELWDKTNDVTGRALLSQPGNTVGLLPLPSLCSGKYLGFDVTGLIPQCNTGGPGSGNVVGPGSSVNGNVAIFSGTTGALLSDGGISGVFKQPVAYPSNITSGHSFCPLDADCQYGNLFSQYPLGSVSGLSLIVGKAGSTIGSHVNATTFKIIFASPGGITGSPVTVTYTATPSDTTNDLVAANLCSLVNTTIKPLIVNSPQQIFCQALGAGGIFNLQYTSAFSATGATPLTSTTTGSTGTISLASEVNTLDFVLAQWGRNPTARPSVVNDGLYAFDFACNDFSGVYNTHCGQMTIGVAGVNRGQLIFLTAGGAEYQLNKGLALYNASGVIATGGTLGLGTINVPSGYYINNNLTSKITTQVFTTGTNATYTTPAGVTAIEIEIQGGGGGGAGSGTTPGAAGAGGNTCWNTSGTACTTPLYQATGGGAGITSGAPSAGGGIAGSASCNDSMAGGSGGGASGVLPNVGAGGGISRYGGAGVISAVASAGVAAVANSGSGGSGGGTTATANSGGGGAAGGWCYAVILAPAASYTYTVGALGAAGTAGTGGVVGGAGATGKIRVIERYN